MNSISYTGRMERAMLNIYSNICKLLNINILEISKSMYSYEIIVMTTLV